MSAAFVMNKKILSVDGEVLATSQLQSTVQMTCDWGRQRGGVRSKDSWFLGLQENTVIYNNGLRMRCNVTQIRPVTRMYKWQHADCKWLYGLPIVGRSIFDCLRFAYTVIKIRNSWSMKWFPSLWASWRTIRHTKKPESHPHFSQLLLMEE